MGEQRKTLRGINQWVTRSTTRAKLAQPDPTPLNVMPMKNMAVIVAGLLLLAGLFWWMKPAPTPVLAPVPLAGLAVAAQPAAAPAAPATPASGFTPAATRSAPVKIFTMPGIAIAAVVSIELIRACG